MIASRLHGQLATLLQQSLAYSLSIDDSDVENDPLVIEFTAYHIIFDSSLQRLHKSHSVCFRENQSFDEMANMLLAWSPRGTNMTIIKTRLLQSCWCFFNTSQEKLLSALATLFDQLQQPRELVHVKTAAAIAMLCEKCSAMISQSRLFPITKLVEKVFSCYLIDYLL